MTQGRPIQITHGTLILDDQTLREAHIGEKARVIVKERAIIIVPDEDVVEDTFGWIKIPRATAKEIALSKDLEYDT
jgi:hypothetical protein